MEVEEDTALEDLSRWQKKLPKGVMSSVSCGQGRVAEDGKVRPLDVKKGDRVLFGKYAGTEIKIDGSDFLMMREEDILGILSN